MRSRPFILLCSLLAACTTGADPVSDKEPQKVRDEGTAARETTVEDIEAGIRTHIASVKAEHNGFFPVPYEGDTMYLKLVRVHTEYLSNLGPERHFACVDLVDESGDVYDVDFFLDGAPGTMDVTETTVHKTNGKPFYNWRQLKDKSWKRVATDQSDNRLMGVVEGEDRFTFRYETTLPEISDSARLWLPIATSDDFQQVTIREMHIEATDTSMYTEPRFGNRILYARLSPEHSGSTVSLVYEVKRQEKPAWIDTAVNPGDYLGGSELLPVGGRFTAIVDSVLNGKESDSALMKARALYDYVIDTVRYRKAGEYGTGDANFACDSRSGNCTEFHSLFLSLARSAAIPARFAIGAAIPSERNEGGVNGYHCWAEFYAEGKWWPVDLSEADKYSALSTYYFGHHPANRIELSRGRDLRPEPLPASGAIPFFAYPLLEVNGKKVQTKTSFSFQRLKEAAL